MSAPAFTPGPWRVDLPWKNDVVCDAGGITATATKSVEGKSVTVQGPIAADDEQSYANAHLIAAAPDLYEALVELRRVGDDKMAFRSEWSAAVAKADTALAKARGETA